MNYDRYIAISEQEWNQAHDGGHPLNTKYARRLQHAESEARSIAERTGGAVVLKVTPVGVYKRSLTYQELQAPDIGPVA